jgi:small subunit ribosomal protein S3
MGQKINPNGFRLPVTRNWTSRWYAVGRNFSRTLGEDLKVRSFLEKKLKNASVGRILIERPANNARITIYTARPGIVIGKQGADIEVLKAEVQKMMGVPVHVDIEEIRRCSLSAYAPCAVAGFPRRSHYVPPRHEARYAERDASRCQGHQDHVLWSSEWR